MSNSDRSILIKISGEIFNRDSSQIQINALVSQVATLCSKATISIVIGGGNFFRGKKDSERLGLSEVAGHEVGMLATLMNGRILQNLLQKQNVAARLFSAFSCDGIAELLSSHAILSAKQKKECMIFAGGLGVPFFTTDTTAIARALQVQSQEVWKATTVDGIYTADPRTEANAQLLKKVSYNEVLEKKLEVMDLTAILMAQEHNLTIRIFSLFKENSLLMAYNDSNFGSIVQ